MYLFPKDPKAAYNQPGDNTNLASFLVFDGKLKQAVFTGGGPEWQYLTMFRFNVHTGTYFRLSKRP